MKKEIDFFISHAFEDKADFVKKLADNLMINGASLFYDEYSIKLGDNISDKINNGLTISNHAVIILSQHFFEKRWTNAELQAIFSKSIYGQYKIFIIYHGITHDDVLKVYPLLADKKAINSSIGIEKITEELFNAINKPFILSYIKAKLTEVNKLKDGISISMIVGFPNRLNKNENKTLYELGNPEAQHSRLKILLWKYERIYFEITDSKFRKYSVSVDFNKWNSSEMHFIHASLNLENKKMAFIIDDDIIEEIQIPDIFFDSDFLLSATSIIGCSLDLSDPCPFLVGIHSIGGSKTNAEQLYLAFRKYMDSLENLK